MIAEGRSRALRDTLVHIVGEEDADTLMASLGPEKPDPEIQQEQPVVQGRLKRPGNWRRALNSIMHRVRLR